MNQRPETTTALRDSLLDNLHWAELRGNLDEPGKQLLKAFLAVLDLDNRGMINNVSETLEILRNNAGMGTTKRIINDCERR